ncbi:MAG: OadG family transporter subunit [Dorea sp.]
MKRKISLLICMLVMVFSFTGCASTESEITYDEVSIEQVTEFLIDYCANSDATVIEQWESMSDFALEQQLTDAGLPFTPDSFIGALESWQAGLDECGAYIEHGDYTYELSKDELVVLTPVVFEERNATLEFVFDEKLYLESMTVSAEFTMGEILQKAGLNTLLGMGTVFAVLIFIAFIISLFKYIPVIQEKFKKKPVQNNETEAIVEQTVVEEKEEEDLELIAVIAAAIAAAEGTTTDGFVVRSIKRRPSNKWRA